jgi:hypothetical protein
VTTSKERQFASDGLPVQPKLRTWRHGVTKLWGRTKRRKAVEASARVEVADWLDSVANRVDASNADLTVDDLERRVEQLKEELRRDRAGQDV